MRNMKSFLENIDDLLRVNCAISDYYVEFTLNNLNPDEKFKGVQLDVMLPMFRGYRIDSEKYHSEGKLKRLQAIYKGIEREAAECRYSLRINRVCSKGRNSLCNCKAKLRKNHYQHRFGECQKVHDRKWLFQY